MARGHLTPFIVTYTYICFSARSNTARAASSTLSGMLPYQFNMNSTSSVYSLYPIIIHA